MPLSCTSMLHVTRGVLCFACGTVSDATGETCPACAERGTLANLARLLDFESIEPLITKEPLHVQPAGVA